MGLVLDFFDAPDLVAVDDEVPEFVSAVEPGSRPVVLVGAEHDDGPMSAADGSLLIPSGHGITVALEVTVGT